MTPEQFSTLDEAKFALTVRFQVKPEDVSQFRSLLVERVRQSREASAVVDFRLFATHEPNTFVVFESFSSREAWTAFSKEPDTVSFLNSISSMQTSPFQVQFLDLIDLGEATG